MSTQWIVPKDSLETVISLIDTIPAKNGIKASEFIKVSRAGKDGAFFHLSSTLFGKGLIRTGEQFPFEGDLFLDRRLFVPFVNGGKESKASDYIFLSNSKQLLVKHGSRKAFYANGIEIGGYEEPQIDGANVTSVSKKWAQMLDCAATCATDDPITPTLNCVYITQSGNTIELLASNQRMVFYGKVPTDKKLKSDIAFPLGLVQTLREDGVTKLLWTNKFALVEFPKGKIWSAVKSVARKNFPVKDVRHHVKKLSAEPQVCSIQSSVFAKASDRLSSYTVALDNSDLALEIHITKGSKKIELKAGVADSKFTETIHSITEADCDCILEWPIAQVMPVIMFGKDDGNFRIHLAKSGASLLATKNMSLGIGPPVKKGKK